MKSIIKKLKSVILSANFFNRNSKQKWIARPSNRDEFDLKPKDYTQARAVEAINCTVRRSNGFENGFGCGFVMEAAKLLAFEEVGSDKTKPLATKNLTRIKFDPYWGFIEVVNNKPLSTIPRLVLLEDGSMWADLTYTPKATKKAKVVKPEPDSVLI